MKYKERFVKMKVLAKKLVDAYETDWLRGDDDHRESIKVIREIKEFLEKDDND